MGDGNHLPLSGSSVHFPPTLQSGPPVNTMGVETCFCENILFYVRSLVILGSAPRVIITMVPRMQGIP